MRAPSELGRLAAFADEAVDRPGIDELARASADAAHLRVALGDMDDLYIETTRESGPLRVVGRHDGVDASIAGDVEQRLLDEVRNDAGVGAVGDHRRRCRPRIRLRSASALSRSA